MEIYGENSKTDFSSFELKAHIWANVLNRTSDTQFLGRSSDFWNAGKLFSCKHLDLNFSQ